MKLSNFVLTHIKGRNALDLEYFAEVDVVKTTGALWWKKTTLERRGIHRTFMGAWHFTDNGEFTPGFQAEQLERAWEANHDALINPRR